MFYRLQNDEFCCYGCAGHIFPTYPTIPFVNLFQMSPSTFNLLQMVVFIQILVSVTAYNGNRFCGSELTKMLQLACRGKYYSPRSSSQNKRSGNCDCIAMTDDPLKLANISKTNAI